MRLPNRPMLLAVRGKELIFERCKRRLNHQRESELVRAVAKL